MKILITLTAICCATYASANPPHDKYQQALQSMSQQPIKIESVKDSPVKGIKQIVLTGGITREVVYLSDDGEFMFDGNLVNLKAKQNLTEMTQKTLRHDLISEFKKTHKSIDFLPENMTDHITVFTDIDCGYCRKLHQEIEQYNDLGIGISYLFFPRAGVNSASGQKAVNVWCADDQQLAMTAAKNGETPEPLMCPNPIESQFNLGLGVGLHKIGTPTVVLADGTLIPGYLNAQAMKQRINQNN